jgi:hypothetical protein
MYFKYKRKEIMNIYGEILKKLSQGNIYREKFQEVEVAKVTTAIN